MLINFFSNVDTSNKLFTLPDCNPIQSLLKKENLEESNSKDMDESLVLFYENNKNKKVVIKAFSFQPNINGYKVIIRDKKQEIEKAIEKINSLNEIKFIIDKKDKCLFEELKKYGEVIKVPAITELYENKLKIKAYGKEEDVIIYDIFDLVKLGQVLLGKEKEGYVTVYGSAVEGKKIVAINENTTYRDIFNLLNGNEEYLVKIINGGSLKGTPIYNLDNKVSIDSKGILFLAEKDIPSNKKFSCINCAKCLRACPENLNPAKLMDLARRNEKDEFLKFGGDKCIECGLCSFVCPSNIEVSQIIKTAKEFR